jgi:hypothetical protein
MWAMCTFPELFSRLKKGATWLKDVKYSQRGEKQTN